jgi:penicillin-binding protein 2
MAKLKSNKALLIITGTIIIMLIYLLQIASLELFSNKYKLNAENNAVRRDITYPARGLIFDRNKKLLVYNKEYFELFVTPNKIKPFDTNELCEILDIPKEFLIEKLKEAKKYSRWKPSKIYGPFDKKTYSILFEKMFKYKGFEIHKRFERTYALPIAAQVLGYLNEVSQNIIDTSKYYKTGDIIGSSGIEFSYEKVLRGKKGVKYSLVDANNKIVGPYKNGRYDTSAVLGRNVVSTIDSRLQAYGEKLMQNKRGAIVAIEPKTGEILAMVSSPTYDPNLLSFTNLSKNFNRLRTDPNRPLFNRAIGSGTSPPGSTFKVIDALIGLKEGVITTKTSFACNYGFRVSANYVVGCHHAGMVNFFRSIASSCNTYYCHVFVRLLNNTKTYGNVRKAYEAWYRQLQKFGFGRKLGIDLPGESSGTLYSWDRYTTKFKKDNWGPLRVISLAIGQGEMGLTPLQLANNAAIIANRGYYYIPHVVKKIEGGSINQKYLKKNYVGIDSSYFTPVIDAMEQVVQHGTAAGIFMPTLRQCGKTGTAQNPHGYYNSIFIAFAPKNNPKIAIAVYVENGGYGANTAAPIASLMMEKYLRDSISRPYLEQYIINKNIMNRGERTDR